MAGHAPCTTIAGCHRLIPSGSRDPFALRRAAQGVVRILVEAGLDYPLLDLIGDDANLRSFFEERVKYYFREIRATLCSRAFRAFLGTPTKNPLMR